MKKRQLKRKLKQQELAIKIFMNNSKFLNVTKDRENKVQVLNIEDSLEQKKQFFDQIEEANRNLENKDNQIYALQRRFQEQFEMENKKVRKKVKKANISCEKKYSVMENELEDMRDEFEIKLQHLEKEMRRMYGIISFLAYKEGIGYPRISPKKLLKACKKEDKKMLLNLPYNDDQSRRGYGRE